MNKSLKTISVDDIKNIKEYTSSLFAKRAKYLYYNNDTWNFIVNIDKKDNKDTDDTIIDIDRSKTIVHSINFKENDLLKELMCKHFFDLIVSDGFIQLSTFNSILTNAAKQKGKEVTFEWDESIRLSCLQYYASIPETIQNLKSLPGSSSSVIEKVFKVSTSPKSSLEFIELNTDDVFELPVGKIIRLPFIEGLNTVSSAYDKKHSDSTCTAIISTIGSIFYYSFVYENDLIKVTSNHPLFFLRL